MGKLLYTIDIKAPKQKVWDTMLSDATYREWTGAFHEGSYFEGSWDEGSDIKFLGPNEDGTVGGMAARIVKNVPGEYVSIEQLGELVDGEIDTTSENAKQWVGAHENYTFSEADGVTTVKVELEGQNLNDEIIEMFDGMWPAALEKLKEITEK